MCGRYLLREAPENAVHGLWRDYHDDLKLMGARYNICPSQSAPVLIEHEGNIQLTAMNWGFRPFWADKKMAQINARSETVFSSKMFKASARRQRCLVVASGFYEPKGKVAPKPWYVFHQKDWAYMALAGIWTVFEDGESEYANFAILTCDANEDIKAIHHRMPVLLSKDWDMWLDPAVNDEAALQALLQPKIYEDLQHYRVSDYVKNPRNQGEACIDALDSGDETSK